MAKKRRRNSERRNRRVGRSYANHKRTYKRDSKGRFSGTGGVRGRARARLNKRRQRRANSLIGRADYRKASDEQYVRHTGDNGSATDRARLARRNSRDYARAAKLQSKVDGKRVSAAALHKRRDQAVTRSVSRAMRSGRM